MVKICWHCSYYVTTPLGHVFRIESVISPETLVYVQVTISFSMGFVRKGQVALLKLLRNLTITSNQLAYFYQTRSVLC